MKAEGRQFIVMEWLDGRTLADLIDRPPLKLEIDDMLEFSGQITIAADGKRVISTYSAHFDGKDYPYTGDTNLTAIALKRVDAYTWAATNKGAGKANTGTNTVSKDGKTLT